MVSSPMVQVGGTQGTAGKSAQDSPQRFDLGRSLFWSAIGSFGAAYLLLIVAMVAADLQFTTLGDIRAALADPRVRFSVALSFLSCTVSAVLATWFAVPTGYALARIDSAAVMATFGEKTVAGRAVLGVRRLVEVLFDVPVVLPPLVVGISLLVLFQTSLGRWADDQVGAFMRWAGFPGIRGVTYEIPAVILAQFTVATAFAIRIMRATFERIDREPEAIAMVLGATHAQSFAHIALPQAWNGIVNAFTIAWARSLGEFGPILIFAGTARMKTEVLSTTVYLNFSIGNLRGAVTASLLMLALASALLLVSQLFASAYDS